MKRQRRYHGWTCEGPGNWSKGEWRVGFYDDVPPTGWFLSGPGVWARRLGDWFAPAIAEADEILSQKLPELESPA